MQPRQELMESYDTLARLLYHWATLDTSEWVIMEFNVAAGIFHPFVTIKQ